MGGLVRTQYVCTVHTYITFHVLTVNDCRNQQRAYTLNPNPSLPPSPQAAVRAANSLYARTPRERQEKREHTYSHIPYIPATSRQPPKASRPMPAPTSLPTPVHQRPRPALKLSVPVPGPPPPLLMGPFWRRTCGGGTERMAPAASMTRRQRTSPRTGTRCVPSYLLLWSGEQLVLHTAVLVLQKPLSWLSEQNTYVVQKETYTI